VGSRCPCTPRCPWTLGCPALGARSTVSAWARPDPVATTGQPPPDPEIWRGRPAVIDDRHRRSGTRRGWSPGAISCERSVVRERSCDRSVAGGHLRVAGDAVLVDVEAVDLLLLGDPQLPHGLERTEQDRRGHPDPGGHADDA